MPGSQDLLQADISSGTIPQTPPIDTPDGPLDRLKKRSLGCLTNKGAGSKNKELTPEQQKECSERFVRIRKEVGKRVKRVKYCGIKPVSRKIAEEFGVDIVKGEKGSIYYRKMQRCGLVWMCPSCSHKIAKARAKELYEQLKIYSDQGKQVKFVSFTLQHNISQSLEYLLKTLLDAKKFARTHNRYKKVCAGIEFLRTLETKYGKNGHHPHTHDLFVGDERLVEALNVFVDLYKQYLRDRGFLVNEHTVLIEPWNGDIEEIEEYMFKGMLEAEMTSGGLKNGSIEGGKTFFQLIDDPETPEAIIQEYITTMKGHRQYHASRGFFKDVRTKTDEEILVDDHTQEIIYNVPWKVFQDMRNKDIALDFLVVLKFDFKGAREFLELYDVDADFIDHGPPG
jgi:hypothetical protein